MSTLTDTKGHQWAFRIDDEVAFRCKAATGYDIRKIDRFLEVVAEPASLGDLVWHCIQPQAAKQNVSIDDFIASIDQKFAHASQWKMIWAWCRWRGLLPSVALLVVVALSLVVGWLE